SPAATLDKVISGGDPYAAVGAEVDSGDMLSSTGNVSLSSVSVTDDNTDGAPICDVSTLAPTESASCTASHTVDQADLDAGQVDNTGTGLVTPAGGVRVLPSFPTRRSSDLSPAATLDKVISGGDPYAAV